MFVTHFIRFQFFHINYKEMDGNVMELNATEMTLQIYIYHGFTIISMPGAVFKLGCFGSTLFLYDCQKI